MVPRYRPTSPVEMRTYDNANKKQLRWSLSINDPINYCHEI